MESDEDRAVLLERLDEAEARLARLAVAGLAAERPAVALPASGHGHPDPGPEERWEAGQVWAHLAEFPAYWLAQAERIIDAPPDRRARFGRATDAPERLEPIEAQRHRPVTELWAACREGIERVRVFSRSASNDDWTRLGEHVTRGPLTAGFVLVAFVGGHLLEHAAQLESLAEPPPA
jgi:hypothetical protein